MATKLQNQDGVITNRTVDKLLDSAVHHTFDDAKSVGWKCVCNHAGNKGKFCQTCGKAKPVSIDSWICICGTVTSGAFCAECGEARPMSYAEGWMCKCGAVSYGRFCVTCGNIKPENAPKYCCDKCGWSPENAYFPPRFCPDCGDKFDDNDVMS